jgi:hypothetical protein
MESTFAVLSFLVHFALICINVGRICAEVSQRCNVVVLKPSG